MLSYEIWNAFVRVNIALIDTPLGSIHDRRALRLADGSDARLVQGNGGGGERFSALSSSFVRPARQTVTLGFGGGRLGTTATFRASADGWQLDSITPSAHGGGLQMSVVE